MIAHNSASMGSPNSGVAPRSHPMLFVPELIMQFMAYVYVPYLENYKNINAAGLVCRMWREPALSVEWRTSRWKRAISVLVPLRDVDECLWELARTPRPAD
ncbi:hypothetical protein FRB94_009276 [Tulasnella sp. JGI-2019a]|nr:hypothetical protein FRB94_009276 [Tulasnella sp. JGI-2019a]KAG9000135.1 hypothetical protein FRB93_012810 [Tulasnella sp. JGI-2019a]KAG9026484.1 hypothetical protein FRB95_008823 [Tulasnella sp. JGI-2019a]